MKPTIEEVIAAIRDQLTIILNQHALMDRTPLLVLDNFTILAKEQEAEIPSEYLVSVSKLQADLELAKEGLRLANTMGLCSRCSHLESNQNVRDICKKLGVE